MVNATTTRPFRGAGGELEEEQPPITKAARDAQILTGM
jgi:hypothetical protein